MTLFVGKLFMGPERVTERSLKKELRAVKIAKYVELICGCVIPRSNLLRERVTLIFDETCTETLSPQGSFEISTFECNYANWMKTPTFDSTQL